VISRPNITANIQSCNWVVETGFITMHSSVLHLWILDYFEAVGVCIGLNGFVFSRGKQVSFLRESVSALNFPSSSEKAIRRKSGTTRGDSLLDAVYCSTWKFGIGTRCILNMLKLWFPPPIGVQFPHSKNVFVIWLFCEELETKFELCLKVVNLRNCAKLLVSSLEVRNCAVLNNVHM
jgi:hypothetical protein